MGITGNPQDIAARINRVRGVMKTKQADVAVIVLSDPHQSEMVGEHWQALKYFAGFTGSAGTLIVTADKAFLHVDSRYWIQADRQLEGTGIETVRQTASMRGEVGYWIGAKFKNKTVACDATLVGLLAGENMTTQLKAFGCRLVDADCISDAWNNRPAKPTDPVFEHDGRFTGLSRGEKLALIRAEMKDADARTHLVSSLDDIAWILNLRGTDVENTPVFVSYLLVTDKEAMLFIDEKKVPQQVREALSRDGVSTHSYETIEKSVTSCDYPMLVDPARTALAVSFWANGRKLIRETNPSVMMKACKTAKEISCLKDAMVKDAIGFCSFWAWFDEAVNKPGSEITEGDVAAKIEFFREKTADYRGPSFGTISAFAENAALPHYHAGSDGGSIIQGNGMLLIDTGSQYPGGTTDMTRMLAVGNVSDEQKRDVTLVMKGVIALSSMRFPDGMRGGALDAVARRALWNEGIEFFHGTGHGVGYFLNVHEGPQSISCYSPMKPESAMREGMVTSVEPGVYREGKWGVRLENLVANKLALETEFGRFLGFDTLTVVPFDTRLFDLSLLTADERKWINAYHAKVRETLSPLLEGRAKVWLTERTELI